METLENKKKSWVKPEVRSLSVKKETSSNDRNSRVGTSAKNGGNVENSQKFKKS